MSEYRKKHDLSQRQFAINCNLSNAYVSMMEKGVNPKTGERIVPSLPTLKKIADGMNISFDSLLRMTDDMLVSLESEGELKSPTISIDDEQLLEFIALFDNLSDSHKAFILGEMKALSAKI